MESGIEVGTHIFCTFIQSRVEGYGVLVENVPHHEGTCDEGNHRNTYIGETRRQLFQRIAEHSPASKNTAFSAVKNHIAECSHCQDYNITDCFKIIRVCSSGCILSEEALCIKKKDPDLNVQLGQSKGTYTPISIF